MFFTIKIYFPLCIVLYLLLILGRAFCWNFTAANLPEDIFVSKFAVWRNRAFLVIPRWKTERKTVEIKDTLFETIWPESSFPVTATSRIFSPALRYRSIVDKCFRSTSDVDIDTRGRLWVLEVPDEFNCSARILLYDLRRNNQMILSIELSNVPTKDLKSLAVDYWGTKAYIGGAGDESIITFNLEKRRWWKIKIIHGPDVPWVSSTDIAVSRKNSMLYMTDPSSLDLFSIKLGDIRSEKRHWFIKNKEQSVTVHWHGTKMGMSSGLFCDVKGGLHYFMISEQASVRWDTKVPLTAENHSIVFQNESCPCITDYIMDGQKNIWGLINSRCPSSKKDLCKKSSVKSRTAKLGRYPL